MLPFLSLFTLAQVTAAPPPQEVVPLEVPESESESESLAQVTAAPPPQEAVPLEVPEPESEPEPEVVPAPPKQVEIVQPQEVRPFPGRLDEVPVFNSNSPEVVRTEGILLSTFPGQGKRWPSAHLNYAFKGRFDVFSHHIARAATADELRTLYHGILAYNPTRQPITVRLLQSATYLSKPHAPYIDLPDYMNDPFGNVYAGPGSRIVNDVLRGRRQGMFPSSITIPPRQSRMLLNLPIPVGNRAPSSNTRSTLMRLASNGPVYLASMAMFAPVNVIQEEVDGEVVVQRSTERMPTVPEWERLLLSSSLAGPRDRAPTSPNAPNNRFFPGWFLYGRVAGVAKGSQWIGKATDDPNSDRLTIPKPGQAFSYAISTLPRGTLGTGQVQSADMLVRYPDTAYKAHGNYGIQYNLEMPLYNPNDRPKQVAIALQTPLKEDQPREGLRFLNPPEDRIFFRGTIRLRYRDENNVEQKRYVHVVQRRGQQGEPLVVLNMGPRDRRMVEVDFLYPPDATPPQILTVQTLSVPDFQNAASDSSSQSVTSNQPTVAEEASEETDNNLTAN